MLGFKTRLSLESFCFLSVMVLAIPTPVFALRKMQTLDSGLEERQLADALTAEPSTALRSSGLEEDLRVELLENTGGLGHYRSALNEALSQPQDTYAHAIARKLSEYLPHGSAPGSASRQRSLALIVSADESILGFFLYRVERGPEMRVVVSDLEFPRDSEPDDPKMLFARWAAATDRFVEELFKQDLFDGVNAFSLVFQLSDLQEEVAKFFRQNKKFRVVAESAEHRAAIFETQAQRMSILKRESRFISRKRLLPLLDLPPPGEDLKVQIRWMIKRDMPEVFAIEGAVSDFPWTEEDFLTRLRQRNTVGMVAEFDNKILGYMVYELYRSRIHLVNFAVHPSARRRAIGRQMAERVKNKLRKHSRQSLFLETPEINTDLVDFFKNEGFRKVSFLRDYYGDGENAHRMEYRLQPPGVDVLKRETLEGDWDSLSAEEAQKVVEEALNWRATTQFYNPSDTLVQVHHRFKIQFSPVQAAVVLSDITGNRFWNDRFTKKEMKRLVSRHRRDLSSGKELHQDWVIQLPKRSQLDFDTLLETVSGVFRVEPVPPGTNKWEIIIPEFLSEDPRDVLFEEVLNVLNRQRIAGAIASGLEEGMAAEAAPLSDSFEQSARRLDDLRRYYP